MPKDKVNTEVCENCGRAIGRLETPQIWGEHVVCGECYSRLTPQKQVLPYAAPLNDAPSSTTSPHTPVQVIEATSKRWKALQGVGIAAIISGFTIGMVSAKLEFGNGIVAGSVALFFLGCIAYSVGRISAWWFHG